MDGSSVGWLASLIIYKRRTAVYIINSASSLCLRKNVVNLSLLFCVHPHSQLSLWDYSSVIPSVSCWGVQVQAAVPNL
jgi:hypothetical protein